MKDNKLTLRPAQLKRPDDAYKNSVFVSKDTITRLTSGSKVPPLLLIKNMVFHYVVDN